ncbi:kinase-like protein [Exidia glandulosa HHB12029]|uniref:Kinase-like protein n=1 Tax=Exidia glandulosa HHB12029 TaxID=1314781 RepID=A0A165FEZ9_EXIGL|nr:kinase-like protein [Exidia glandulosa HHB12029]
MADAASPSSLFGPPPPPVERLRLDHLATNHPAYKESTRGVLEIPDGFNDLLQRLLKPYGYEARDAVRKTTFTHDSTGRKELVAVKVIAKSRLVFVTRELGAWRALHHEHVLQLYGHCTLEKHIVLVSPWMLHGDLRHYLIDKHDANRQELIVQVANGLVYLHDEAGIVHGDIKAENILIDAVGNVKIADFGLSTRVEKRVGERTTGDTIRRYNTVQFSAPELLLDEARSPLAQPTETFLALPSPESKLRSKTRESDIFAFAMLMLETFTGKAPWANCSHAQIIVKVAHLGQRPTVDGEGKALATARGMNDGYWVVYMWCSEHEPRDRLQIKEVHDLLHLLRDENALLSPLADFPTDEDLRRSTSAAGTTIGHVPSVRKKKSLLSAGMSAVKRVRKAMSLQQGTGHMPIVADDKWRKESLARSKSTELERHTREPQTSVELASSLSSMWPDSCVTQELWQKFKEYIERNKDALGYDPSSLGPDMTQVE